MPIRNFNSTVKKTRFFNIVVRDKRKSIFHDWFPLESFIYIQYFFDVVRNKLQTINICLRFIYNQYQMKIKSSRKEYVMWTCLNFDQWKKFSENYKPIRVWLWLVYKFTENYCRLRLFSGFIQTQKRYFTSLDKISILTWKLIVVSS